MNPAALKANIGSLKKGGTVIANIDAFTDSNFKKCGYESNTIKTHDMETFKVIEANITSQTLEALKDSEIDNKSKGRCKNFYALGITYFMFGRDLEPTIKWVEEKFKNFGLKKNLVFGSAPGVCDLVDLFFLNSYDLRIFPRQSGRERAETSQLVSIITLWDWQIFQLADYQNRQLNATSLVMQKEKVSVDFDGENEPTSERRSR